LKDVPTQKSALAHETAPSGPCTTLAMFHAVAPPVGFELVITSSPAAARQNVVLGQETSAGC
jgi:hypothetical protein